MKTLTLKVPEILEARLNILARKRKSTKSKIIREAIISYLSQEKPSSSGSFLEMADDLTGIVEGPSDLSFNKAHLKGYGR